MGELTPDLKLALMGDDEWPDSALAERDDFAGKLNVYRVMAHNPALLKAWVGMRKHIVFNNALGPERSEIVILRVGNRLGSSYEWNHHISRARKCGIEDARIASLKGDPDGMRGDDALIARAVDECVDAARLTPNTLNELGAEVGKEGVMDLMAIVGFYTTLACLLNTFEPPLDEAIVKELAENPLRETSGAGQPS